MFKAKTHNKLLKRLQISYKFSKLGGFDGKFCEFGKILHKNWLSFLQMPIYLNELQNSKFRHFAKMTCTIAWFCAMSHANLYKTKTKQNFLNFNNTNAHICQIWYFLEYYVCHNSGKRGKIWFKI